MALHEEVGPARTTVAEVARRARVQRPTVYNHFPAERELLEACQGHYLSLNPPPDVAAAMAVGDPEQRVRGVLAAFYGWYRSTEGMTANVQRDRGLVPALDALMTDSLDAQMAPLAAALAAGFGPAGAHERGAMAALALDFFTWQRLSRERLDDDQAAVVMAAAVSGAGVSG